MSSTAVILFAHGARAPEWAQPFEAVRDRLRASGTIVELAFLEFMSPTLEEAAARLAASGHKEIAVVPLFLAQGTHLKHELPALVAKIRERHAKIDIRITPALGDDPEMMEAITAWVQRAAR